MHKPTVADDDIDNELCDLGKPLRPPPPAVAAPIGYPGEDRCRLPRFIASLDSVFHEQSRLAIVSVLFATPSLSFTELRDLLGMTDGNLLTHLRKLEAPGYVAHNRQPGHGRRQTAYRLTPDGHETFARYLGDLAMLVKQSRFSECRQRRDAALRP